MQHHFAERRRIGEVHVEEVHPRADLDGVEILVAERTDHAHGLGPHGKRQRSVGRFGWIGDTAAAGNIGVKILAIFLGAATTYDAESYTKEPRSRDPH